MSPRRINEIVLEKRGVTADTALRLARYFGTSESFWMGLQADYDLERVRLELGDRLDKEVKPHAAAPRQLVIPVPAALRDSSFGDYQLSLLM